MNRGPNLQVMTTKDKFKHLIQIICVNNKSFVNKQAQKINLAKYDNWMIENT